MIDLQEYDVLMGSDVVNDTMYIEVSGKQGYLLTVVRSDADGTMTLHSGESELPVELVEWAIAEARRRLAGRG